MWALLARLSYVCRELPAAGPVASNQAFEGPVQLQKRCLHHGPSQGRRVTRRLKAEIARRVGRTRSLPPLGLKRFKRPDPGRGMVCQLPGYCLVVGVIASQLPTPALSGKGRFPPIELEGLRPRLRCKRHRCRRQVP